ncbi:MAG: tetratricopeptide repeat protein [Acidobacteria bacterium]|nr:tetratricopeptide repeat protein [Acidobacteriota bacterium]
MRHIVHAGAVIAILFLAISVSAQVDEICREASGDTPTRDMGLRGKSVGFLYGTISVKGLDSGAPVPRVVAIFSDSLQPATRQPIGRAGSYCFRHAGVGGLLIIEVDGTEALRKEVADVSVQRQREDYEVTVGSRGPAPGVISAALTRPPNEKTSDLYKKAAAAESEHQSSKEIEIVRSIISIDPQDYVAWSKLGTLYEAQNDNAHATDAFEHALQVKQDYVPALINLGMIHAFAREFPKAIELFRAATAADPSSARAFRMLGEAYLQNRQGTLGLAALDKAIEIDPVGMAECHLLKARLYDLAGAKNLAAAEYRVYLKKVPDSPDRQRYEQYIKDNPPD